MKTIIYAYTKDNQAYIGKTKNPYYRKNVHKQRFRDWDYKILDEIYSIEKEDWKPYECAWIQIYAEWGYEMLNKNKGGGGPQGWQTDEQQKAKKYQHYLDNPHLYTGWDKKNPEKKAEHNRQYYLANKEKHNEYSRQYMKLYRQRRKLK